MTDCVASALSCPQRSQAAASCERQRLSPPTSSINATCPKQAVHDTTNANKHNLDIAVDAASNSVEMRAIGASSLACPATQSNDDARNSADQTVASLDLETHQRKPPARLFGYSASAHERLDGGFVERRCSRRTNTHKPQSRCTTATPKQSQTTIMMTLRAVLYGLSTRSVHSHQASKTDTLCQPMQNTPRPPDTKQTHTKHIKCLCDAIWSQSTP
jgi:hypothetical protein